MKGLPVSLMKRYIALFRVSTDKQGVDGYGMDSQRQIVRRFVESQNGVLEKEFSEVISGRKTADERPELAAALDYAKKNKGTRSWLMSAVAPGPRLTCTRRHP